MYKTIILLLFVGVFCQVPLLAQTQRLSLQQQKEDFAIFKGALQEGHAGLYYFIDKNSFQKKCDSIENTFTENASIESFYLRLRYLIASLRHGHSGVSLPNKGNVNYRMAVLETQKLYLPFELLIANNQLIIKEDCSKEQLFPRYAILKSIGNQTSQQLIQKMLAYMPADGINETFKTYSLSQYFYFHFLYNLLYPNQNGVKIEIEKSQTHYYIELLTPKTVDSIYYAKNGKSISQYGTQLAYKANLPNKSAYIKIGTFYKGLIEQFGQNYEAFLANTFEDIAKQKTKNVIVDLRNNEGGGDGYENILLQYLAAYKSAEKTVISVPAKQFKYTQYTVDITDDIKGFIDNPSEFLQNDSSLFIKEKYVDLMIEGRDAVAKHPYTGKLIILTNGGSFSASTTVIAALYQQRQTTQREVVFVGEENGGDIYAVASCSGQGYPVKLPASSIRIDMPFFCFGTLNTKYPKKKLPDYKVFDSPESLSKGADKVLDAAIKLSAKTTSKR